MVCSCYLKLWYAINCAHKPCVHYTCCFYVSSPFSLVSQLYEDYFSRNLFNAQLTPETIKRVRNYLKTFSPGQHDHSTSNTCNFDSYKYSALLV